MRHHKGISNRSVLLMYQLRRCDNVSAWSRKFKLVTKMSLFFGCKAVGFYGVSCDSIPFRYRLVCHYDVSKMFLVRHQIWPLYKLLNWSVSLRYHFCLHAMKIMNLKYQLQHEIMDFIYQMGPILHQIVKFTLNISLRWLAWLI